MRLNRIPAALSAATLVCPLVLGAHAHAHTESDAGSDAHPHSPALLSPAESFITPAWFLAQAVPPQSGAQPTARTAQTTPRQATVFERFSPKVAVRWDEQFLYVEDNGMPAHNMMVGITSWQQQVPLPQKYTGNNAWRIPLHPVPATEPVSIRGRFLRGAVAVAVNGIPIFNPQNNRGEVSAEIGELDQWGGHCGRADDYHYHAAPLHLQNTAGPGQPIAYALDGYPLYGLSEPDGKPPTKLDAFNGHADAVLGYHYHASTKYPYVNGGFHGTVTEKDGQVDPQPRAQPVRDSLTALRGAKITSFESNGKNVYKLGYELNTEKRAVLYALNADGSVTFEFQNGRDGTSRATYTTKQGGGNGPRENNDPPPRPQGTQPPPSRPNDGGARPPDGPRPSKRGEANAPSQGSSLTAGLPHPADFILRSPDVSNGSELPVEYTGDGAGSTLPLEWSGPPAQTKSLALVMHHLDPEGKTKWYWILYNIPPTTRALAKNNKEVGTLGSNFRGQIGYEPPHSKGPGAKTYTLTLFALSSPVDTNASGTKMDFETIMAAMKGKILAATDLTVVYTRAANASDPQPPQGGKNQRGGGKPGGAQPGPPPPPPPR